MKQKSKHNKRGPIYAINTGYMAHNSDCVLLRKALTKEPIEFLKR